MKKIQITGQILFIATQSAKYEGKGYEVETILCRRESVNFINLTAAEIAAIN